MGALTPARIKLEAALLTAFTDRQENGEDNAVLAADIANAIHEYVLSAEVNIQQIVTTDPGGAMIAGVATVATMSSLGGPGVGSGPAVGGVTSPTICQHVGLGKLQ